MSVIQIVLAVSALLCGLVAGLVFAFAIVVIPGIKSLEDRDFLRAFVKMDRVIQNNQPIFILVWVGSAVAVLGLAALSIWQLDGMNRLLAVAFSTVYLVGVQLPTIAINIPLNNELQSLELDSTDDAQISAARRKFESRWVWWNSFRTIAATIATAGFIVLALLI